MNQGFNAAKEVKHVFTIAKLIGKDLTQYGVSMVNVRETGMRHYARIFQRTNPDDQLMVKVACVTDRDIMPDCAPAICIRQIVPNYEKEDRNLYPILLKFIMLHFSRR